MHAARPSARGAVVAVVVGGIALLLGAPAGAAEPGPAYPPGAGAPAVVTAGGDEGSGDGEEVEIGEPARIDRVGTPEDPGPGPSEGGAAAADGSGEAAGEGDHADGEGEGAPAAEAGIDAADAADRGAPGGGGSDLVPLLVVAAAAVLLAGGVVAIARRI